MRPFPPVGAPLLVVLPMSLQFMERQTRDQGNLCVVQCHLPSPMAQIPLASQAWWPVDNGVTGLFYQLVLSAPQHHSSSGFNWSDFNP